MCTIIVGYEYYIKIKCLERQATGTSCPNPPPLTTGETGVGVFHSLCLSRIGATMLRIFFASLPCISVGKAVRGVEKYSREATGAGGCGAACGLSRELEAQGQ